MFRQMSFIEKEPKCVLMSLREEYFAAMMNNTKKYEYRTRYLKEESDAYIYISKTKKSIVAKIKFGIPIIADAKTIASLAEKEEPGCFDSMMEYMYNDIGYALPIESITLIEPIGLEKLRNEFPDFVVPQSYYSLDKKPKLKSLLESRLEKQLSVKKR